MVIGEKKTKIKISKYYRELLNISCCPVKCCSKLESLAIAYHKPLQYYNNLVSELELCKAT